MNLIEIKNLKRTFGEEIKTHALKNATFTVKQGEFIAIMGSSGSGKSTLMHILGLLDRASGGNFLFEERDVSKLDDNELAILRNEEIGFVFQSFNLLPRTTVLDNVTLPLIYSHKKVSTLNRAKEVLESVGLSHRLNHYTNQISGGEKQRVAIARALVNRPSIIFADEPTGNLDSKSGAQIMKILQKLNDEGNTVILVTHETYTAECAKRILKMKDGEIISDEITKNQRRVNPEDLIK
ncbi:MAG: ABC transporter ATP-binding protein [Candidatus Pacebacteria bacterium]|nr:ABC transporter ATP-binding protein [Candidatus Paceibacterota bacterium]